MKSTTISRQKTPMKIQICGFCRCDITNPELLKVMGQPIGPYESVFGDFVKVHTYCALWAP